MCRILIVRYPLTVLLYELPKNNANAGVADATAATTIRGAGAITTNNEQDDRHWRQANFSTEAEVIVVAQWRTRRNYNNFDCTPSLLA